MADFFPIQSKYQIYFTGVKNCFKSAQLNNRICSLAIFENSGSRKLAANIVYRFTSPTME